MSLVAILELKIAQVDKSLSEYKQELEKYQLETFCLRKEIDSP
jgi:hypothetical protein